MVNSQHAHSIDFIVQLLYFFFYSFAITFGRQARLVQTESFVHARTSWDKARRHFSSLYTFCSRQLSARGQKPAWRTGWLAVWLVWSVRNACWPHRALSPSSRPPPFTTIFFFPLRCQFRKLCCSPPLSRVALPELQCLGNYRGHNWSRSLGIPSVFPTRQSSSVKERFSLRGR